MFIVIGCSGIRGCAGRAGNKTPVSQPGEDQTQAVDGEIMITIVYDNNAGREDLTTSWGFSCVVQGLEKTILFDTGGNGRILMSNMQKVGLDPQQIDAVVISHSHGDHTGGLASFLDWRGKVPVYIPRGMRGSFEELIGTHGGQSIVADDCYCGTGFVCEGV